MPKTSENSLKDIEELGRNSAKYYEENFRKDKFIDTLLAELGESENAILQEEKML